jgi:xanthine dehydrogenase accessory factor
MGLDLDELAAAVARHGSVARVVVAEVRGSAPREPGAAMLVWHDGQAGTIGGGALEWEAAARARVLLAEGTAAGARIDRLPLGPMLGQCCGGAVTLVTEVWDEAALRSVAPEAGVAARPVAGAAPAMPLAVRRRLRAARAEGATGGPALIAGWMVEPLTAPGRPLWIWGAGHVGRALVKVMAPLPDVSLTWVDTAVARFPEAIPGGVTRLVAADPVTLVRHAPADARHIILTFSHTLDLALCHALLGRGFASCGLIGSRSKWSRFRSRLAALGHPPEAVERIACPIGTPALGKHPQAIAISVAAALLSRSAEVRSAEAPREKAGRA